MVGFGFSPGIGHFGYEGGDAGDFTGSLDHHLVVVFGAGGFSGLEDQVQGAVEFVQAVHMEVGWQGIGFHGSAPLQSGTRGRGPEVSFLVLRFTGEVII